MGGVVISILGRPQRLAGPRLADPLYTLTGDEPHVIGSKFAWPDLSGEATPKLGRPVTIEVDRVDGSGKTL